MKYFLIGVAAFLIISAVVYGLGFVLDSFGLTKDQSVNVFMALMLLLLAKPFGELTVSVFKLEK